MAFVLVAGLSLWAPTCLVIYTGIGLAVIHEAFCPLPANIPTLGHAEVREKR